MKTELKKLFKYFTTIFIIIIFTLNAASCSGIKAEDPVLLRCNGLDINKSTFILCMIDEAAKMYEDNDGSLTADNYVKAAKDKALSSLKLYTYYKQGYTEQNYKFADGEVSKMQGDILLSLLSAGFQDDPKDPDKAFLENFGVTFDQYMKYREESQLANYYYKAEVDNIVLLEGEANSYFLKNKQKYGICSAQVFLLNENGNNDIAVNIRTDIYRKVSIAKIQSNYKDYIAKFVNLNNIDKTSNVNEAFGDDFKETLLDMSESATKIINNNKGIMVVKVLAIKGFDENLPTIESDLKISKYAAILEKAINSPEYDVKIVNQELYDSIKEIPGGEAAKKMAQSVTQGIPQGTVVPEDTAPPETAEAAGTEAVGTPGTADTAGTEAAGIPGT